MAIGALIIGDGQAASAALNRHLFRHPDAIREIEARFGAQAYPHRVLMG